jgi:hypothetical protein
MSKCGADCWIRALLGKLVKVINSVVLEQGQTGWILGRGNMVEMWSRLLDRGSFGKLVKVINSVVLEQGQTGFGQE